MVLEDDDHFERSLKEVPRHIHAVPTAADRLAQSIQAFVREFGERMIPTIELTKAKLNPFESYKARFETYQLEKAGVVKEKRENKNHQLVVHVAGVLIPVDEEGALNRNGTKRVVAPCYLAQCKYSNRGELVGATEIPFAKKLVEGDHARVGRTSTNIEPFAFQVYETGDIWTLVDHVPSDAQSKWSLRRHEQKTLFVVFDNPHVAQARVHGVHADASQAAGPSV